jgi:hypothetical protein
LRRSAAASSSARDRFADGPEAGAAWLLSGIIERAPTAMFLLLPAFAGLLKLVYLRQRRLYIEHVVFALHTHAFAFVVFTVALLLRGNVAVMPVLFTGMLLYVLVAMRRVYGQGWPITLVKFSFLSASYFALLGATLTVVVLAALLL